MPHVQRTSGVGGDELDHHALAVGSAAAEACAITQHLAHHLLLGSGLELDVDEAGTGDVHRLDPLLVGRCGLQGGTQLLGHLARRLLQRLGQLHGRRGGEVAVGGHLGRFIGSPRTGAGLELLEHGGQRLEQFVFDRQHGA